MKELWAPWRLEYIRHIREPDGCFLCRMFAERDERKNLILRRGPTCAVVMNRFPYSNGHLLVCPYRHGVDFSDLTPEERLGIMDLLDAAVRALKSAMHPDGFNIGVNLGRAAGAGLEEHLHVHVVPRWHGDTNFMPVMADVKVIPQGLDELWQQLSPAMS
jgi:ATP adenylyltransferase